MNQTHLHTYVQSYIHHALHYFGKEEHILTTTSTGEVYNSHVVMKVMVVHDKMTLVDKYFMFNMQRRGCTLIIINDVLHV